MIEIRIEGDKEVVEFLEGIREKLSSSEFWAEILGKILQKALRFAASISPVVTGSYRAAHRLATEAAGVSLSIDPAARNTISHQPVTRYAAAVEERHRVYERTAAFVDELLDKDVDVLLEELLR